tara:strand:- start:278 stop:520 length:243 start_codon:yes stop_codon:yes gene_type:complete
MAKVKFLEDFKYSIDKVNATESKAGDIVELPNGLASRLVTKGVCTQAGVFNPVAETAVANPVEEVKAKPKRKKSTKKKAE